MGFRNLRTFKVNLKKNLTHTDAAKSPSIVMYIISTYCAAKLPKKGNSNSTDKDEHSNARRCHFIRTGSNLTSAFSKRMNYISGMVVKTRVASITEEKYIIHRKLMRKDPLEICKATDLCFLCIVYS